MVTAFAISAAGVYLILARGSASTPVGAVGNILNAVLIAGFGARAWRRALAGDIASHRRWALRTYLAVNGVWFFRVGLMAWLIVNQGPVGIGENFDGPFILFWSFAAYLLPLAVLEVYLRTRDRTGPTGRLAMAAGLFFLTALMGIGIFGAAGFMWLPQI